MNFPYDIGERVVVELKNSCLVEGDYSTSTDTRVELINVDDWAYRNLFKGPLSFYFSEIASIKVLHPDWSENNEHKQCKRTDLINLPLSEFVRLRDMSREYVYLPVVDQKYVKAIEYIRGCECIGIAAFGFNLFDMKALALLVLTSWDRVFIFDLLSYRRVHFPPDLKEILESEFIKKVGHGLLEPIEFFWHYYKVAIKNIFDTQLADLKLQKHEKDSAVMLRSLPNCLNLYFNFPASILSNVENIELKQLQERPLQESTKVYVSMLAAYLIVLYNKQEKLLLAQYYELVEEQTKLIKE
ncbi:hypothetical protein PPYR_13384 [Photinus pyralis]|uniref:3'-5' exonuclease domain-containing protein n=1 Tax=Photinus pyralis TaxID=7054 RepID=A0A1Y1KI46_PHOPY|nr:uncharacterized protein LOC116178461 [Photinus pyralis]KAB0793764.1 hypothetical protein PPYR_13384 [Photinus pyralis]